jgi:glucuronate isomerase
MMFMGREYHHRDWVMQLHYNCLRDNNTFMYDKIGPDTGFDAINNFAPSSETANFLNALNSMDALPKTILYSLNPNDNAVIDAIIGCFQREGTIGKMQHGSAWWFNDHKTGMTEQITFLANHGLLGNFVGMLTDSRSFLSYTRHEYFRRILCDIIGTWVENGEYPADMAALKKLIERISYNNALRYFGFKLEKT